jgi:hypothetical protein
MRIPNESLDDFNSNAAQPEAVAPPPVLSLRLTGDTELLKPLASGEDPVKSEAAVGDAPVRATLQRISWFHRSLAVGGGLAIIALLLSITFYTAIYGPPAEPVSEAATDGQPADTLTPSEEPDTSDLLSAVDSPFAFDGLAAVRKVPIPRHARARGLHSIYRPRRLVRRPQLMASDFVPTALIIYAENGEIKTRIEPQLTAAYKKELPLPN